MISIRIGDQPVWSLNIISRCYEDHIDIPLTNDLIKNCIFIDAHITIKYKNDFYEYVITGTIVAMELSSVPFVTVRIRDINAKLNHRSFPRRDTYLPATLCYGDDSSYCTISNLSLSGVAFLLDKKLENDLSCELIVLLNKKASFFVKGKILRSIAQDSLYKYGIMFTFMDDENSNRLHTYLHSVDNSYNFLKEKYLFSRK